MVQREPDAAFDALADLRWREVCTTGETMAWEEVKLWLEARSRGENPPKPAARRIWR